MKSYGFRRRPRFELMRKHGDSLLLLAFVVFFSIMVKKFM